MKNDGNDTGIADLYQEVSRLKSQVFEKCYECEMLKIQLSSAKEESDMWHGLYNGAMDVWIGPQPEYTNDLMRCK